MDTKAVTKYEGPKKNFAGPEKKIAAPKLVSFLQLTAEKKTPKTLHLEKNIGPSYFVTTLVPDTHT